MNITIENFKRLVHFLTPVNSPTEFSPYSIFKPRDNKFEEVKAGPFKNEYIIIDQTYAYSLVIPAYNEEKRIGPFLTELTKGLNRNWEIIVVCDGNDRTADIARSHNGRFKVIESKHRLGKGGAILEGFKASIGDVIGYVDADGAIAVSEILKVFSCISEGCDVAVGSRWLNSSVVVSKQPLIRTVLGRLYHYLTFTFLRLTIKDTQCGIKAFRRSALLEVIPKVTIRNLSFDTSLLYNCKKSGSEIREVPIVWSHKDGSRVNSGKAAVVMFLSLIGIWMAHLKNSEVLLKIIISVWRIVEDE